MADISDEKYAKLIQLLDTCIEFTRNSGLEEADLFLIKLSSGDASKADKITAFLVDIGIQTQDITDG